MPGETEARVALAVPEQEPGDDEEHREGGGEDRVDLLAGVEAPLRRAGVAGQEAGGRRGRRGRSRGSCARARAGSRAGRSAGAHQPRRPPSRCGRPSSAAGADAARERRQVEDETRAEQGEEGGRVHPVQEPLGEREARGCSAAHAALVAVRAADPRVGVVAALLPVAVARRCATSSIRSTHLTFL